VNDEPAIISALATIIAGLLTSSGLSLGGLDVAAVSTGAATILASLLVALVTRQKVFSKNTVGKLGGQQGPLGSALPGEGDSHPLPQ
jgi:hypothetical protein